MSSDSTDSDSTLNDDGWRLASEGKLSVKTPWMNAYGEVPAHLEYSTRSMCGEVFHIRDLYPKNIAYTFMGKKTNYCQAVNEIEKCAKALKALGVKPDEKVTICMPNCPQAVTMFYAINMIGAIANMIHPLSSENEIAFYLKDSKSVLALTLDQFFWKFEKIQNDVKLPKLIIADIRDALSPLMAVGYTLTSKIKKVPRCEWVTLWKDFMKGGESFSGDYSENRKPEQPAVMLYSGGTTGVTKGILLSNLNFNALSAQIRAMSNVPEIPGKSMLAVMPMFHGFGLGVSIHSMLTNVAYCILFPRFTPKSYAKLIKKTKPNFIAGVPSLYEVLLRNNYLEGADLSCLMGVFSGGDSLSIELKNRFDKFLSEHKCPVPVREGYGTTECVTASCLTPYHIGKEGSIGIPLPDMYFKIVKPGTEEEVPYGDEGEICLAGPTVMMEYVNQPSETADTKRLHKDGLTWIHTGDLGVMDAEGFIYFRQRIKRMIVTNGYNVYPSNIENVLDSNEYVHMSCVIGVKDPIKIQKVKAFVMLKPGVTPSDEVKQKILSYCKKHIARYALPYDIEFRDQLPKTLVGKVAYRVLEEEEAQKERQ